MRQWLKNMVERVQSAGPDGGWHSVSWRQASEAMGRCSDDVGIDLVGCLIDEILILQMQLKSQEPSDSVPGEDA